MRYRVGASKSSVRYQPPTFTGVPVGLNNSMASTAVASGLVRISLMTMAAVVTAPESLVPGEPSSLPLGRQLDFRPHAAVGRFSSTICKAKPAPLVGLPGGASGG